MYTGKKLNYFTLKSINLLSANMHVQHGADVTCNGYSASYRQIHKQ